MSVSFFLFWVMVAMAALIWCWEIGARLVFGDTRPRTALPRNGVGSKCDKPGCRSANPPHARGANLHLLGRVSDDDLANLYAHALCLAFPSRSEGFGLPLLEAMALGCPIIAAPIPSSREVCGDGALYAGADDGEAWLRAIERVAQSANLRAEMVGQGRIRAQAYSWRETALGYLNLVGGGRP